MSDAAPADSDRFALTFEHASVGIAIADARGRYLDVNPAMCRMLARSRDELIGSSYVDITHPEDRARSQALSDALFDGSREQAYERKRYLRGDGSVLWADVSAANVRGPDGSVRFRVVHLMDAAELIAAEEARRQFDDRFRRFVEQAPDPVIVVDVDGCITLCNRRTTEVFGYTPEEIVGLPVELLVPDRSRDAHEGLRKRYSAAPVVRQMGNAQLRGRRKDGTEFDIDVSLGPIDIDDGSAVVAIVRDLSERHRARVAIETERAQSEFLSRMSHELRTPLNSVLGFAQLLEMGELRDDQRDAVAQIMRAGAHLRDLLTDVLEYQRAQSGRITFSIESVVAEAIAADALGIVAPLAREHGVELAPAPVGETWVQADRARVRQILLNLLTNAVKYNHVGGHVEVKVRRADGSVLVEVRDDGRGIERQHLPLLFTPFERLGAETTGVEGAGVGLPLARSLAEAMGGSIEVASEPDRGSTFSVRLTAAPAVDEPDDVAPAPVSRSQQRRGAVVLYIDDNDANVALLEQMLERRGMVRVVSAPTMADGLAIARRLRPDVLLLDLHLPDGSGRDVIEALRREETTAGIPVVVVSADATPASINELLDAGVVGYVTKPIIVTDLFDAIDRAIA